MIESIFIHCLSLLFFPILFLLQNSEFQSHWTNGRSTISHGFHCLHSLLMLFHSPGPHGPYWSVKDHSPTFQELIQASLVLGRRSWSSTSKKIHTSCISCLVFWQMTYNIIYFCYYKCWTDMIIYIYSLHSVLLTIHHVVNASVRLIFAFTMPYIELRYVGHIQ